MGGLLSSAPPGGPFGECGRAPGGDDGAGEYKNLDPTTNNPRSVGSKYHRWDQMNNDISSDVEEFSIPGGPRVTKLSRPSKVTWGGPDNQNGIKIEPMDGPYQPRSTKKPLMESGEYPWESKHRVSDHNELDPGPLDYQKWDRLADGVSDTFYSGDDAEAEMKREEQEKERELAEARERAREAWYKANQTGVSNATLEEQLARFANLSIQELKEKPKSGSGKFHFGKENKLTMAYMTENGAQRTEYMWRQTALEVDVFLIVPRKVTNKMITVRQMEQVQHKPHVEILHFLNITINGTLYFKRQLAYQVKHEKVYDGGLMWSLHWYDGENGAYTPMRLLHVTLIKEHRYHHMLKHWWTNVFEGEPEINVVHIKARKDPERISEFMKVWEEAHNDFKLRAQNDGFKINITLDSEDYDRAMNYSKKVRKHRNEGGWGIPGVDPDKASPIVPRKPKDFALDKRFRIFRDDLDSDNRSNKSGETSAEGEEVPFSYSPSIESDSAEDYFK